MRKPKRSSGFALGKESEMAEVLAGVDTGGTFTDIVLLQDGKLRVHKVL